VPSYVVDTFTLTGVGYSGTAPSGTATYVKIGRQVTVILPALNGTSNAGTFGLSGVPAALTPAAGVLEMVLCQDFGIGDLVGFVSGTTGNVWSVGKVGNAPWNTTNAKILWGGVLTYVTAT
jgi:hypothetical protein